MYIFFIEFIDFIEKNCKISSGITYTVTPADTAYGGSPKIICSYSSGNTDSLSLGTTDLTI